MNDYNDKAYQIITTEGTFYLPKSQVYEILERGCFASQWYLNEGNNRSKPIFFTNDRKSFSKGEAVTTTRTTVILKAAPKPVSFIPVEVFKQSLKGHEENNFVKFLLALFGSEITGKLIGKYFIGTSKHWPGANVFWQIDIAGKMRTGKIMLYNPTTGKRIKEPFNHISWVHTALKLPEYELKQCFFGEHLLQDKTKPLALFESEKTAVIASVYLPQFICLAVGSLSNLTESKCQVLQGRTVTLFPDLNGFEKWSEKAKEFSHIAAFTISDLLERKATDAERKQGLDLADYLIRFDYKHFALQEPQPIKAEQPAAVQPLIEQKQIEPIAPAYYFKKPEQVKPESWEQKILELETYFTQIELPKHPVKLNSYSTITNVSKLLESHFATVKANDCKRTFLPFLNRLQELKQVLTTNLN